ncbi:retrovirus-related pol polyprotein from transposon TNT 1-94, partial [Tanacetum coccineum]
MEYSFVTMLGMLRLVEIQHTKKSQTGKKAKPKKKQGTPVKQGRPVKKAIPVKKSVSFSPTIKKSSLNSGEGSSRDAGKSPQSPKWTKRSLVTYKWIAHQFAKEIINDPFMPYIKLKDAIRQKFMIDGMKDGWLEGCRRVIGLDGCFSKYTCRGELLTAMGRNANNQMYPIAWAVVRVENSKNWGWFLALLHDDLKLQQGTGLTLISDGHKGLHDAVRDWLPNSEHRKCT